MNALVLTDIAPLFSSMKKYIRWSDATVICGHIMTSMLCRNMAYCVKLGSEDLLHYSENWISWFKHVCIIIILL